jgi:hypothetical protein
LATRLLPELIVVVPVPSIPFAFRIPAFTVVLRAESLAVNVTTPVPFLLMFDGGFPEINRLPLPVKVRVPVPEIAPPSVSNPASDPMLALPFKVIGPAKELVPLMFSMAPLPAGPVPATLTGSAVV